MGREKGKRVKEGKEGLGKGQKRVGKGEGKGQGKKCR